MNGPFSTDSGDSPAVALLRRIELFAPLGPDERQGVCEIPWRVRRLAAGETLVDEHEPSGGVTLVLAGLMARYRILADGRRPILGFSTPGDLCDLSCFVLHRMDHAIGAIGATSVAIFNREAVLEMLERHPAIMRGFWWSSLIEEAIARTWLANVGQRTASARLAHLVCELYYRFAAAGLAADGVMELPLTQTDLADCLGLSAVHVNRTLQELRRSGLLRLRGKTAQIPDLPALEAAASFTPDYLHLERRMILGRRRERS